ncbi:MULTISPECIES: hypothetical protein [unclassified Bradyrhizobium]|uniref:hypothetical protein n=1 Tax=unclassified Bradyrhizobium TaxID=2631580 RepID=UPI0004877B7D|nr:MULTISPECIES: hypothetical protein [unclassified Bradyrhizobium]MCP3464845.1 hypothetical protein [Bradyrhizobium sp. CCGUVB23]
MWKYLLLLALLTSPVMAQVKPTPKTTAARTDPCAPIGRTADGKLVYSMKCENLPAPPTPPPQAELKEAPPPAAEPEPETRRSGIFGWSYDRR